MNLVFKRLEWKIRLRQFFENILYRQQNNQKHLLFLQETVRERALEGIAKAEMPFAASSNTYGVVAFLASPEAAALKAEFAARGYTLNLTSTPIGPTKGRFDDWSSLHIALSRA